MFKFRNRYWSFKIEHKVFVTQLLRDGGGVRISERTRLRSFELELDVAAAVWCLEVMQEILSVEDSKIFCRKYRGSNFVLLVDKFSNKKGVFLKFTKLLNGTLKNIIVPGGSSLRGWRRLMVCLDNLVGRRFWSSKGGSLMAGFNRKIPLAFDKDRYYKQPNTWRQRSRSWREVAGFKAEDQTDTVNKKDWKNVVLVFRFNVLFSWSSIQLGLSKWLNSQRILTPIASDRAALWCANREEKIRLEKVGLYNSPGVGQVKFVKWTPESQLMNTKIECTNSWIGIEGLPLSLWNKHVFKVIGSKCGGLLDIASCTLNLKCLSHAVIKLKGKKGRLIQEHLDIYCWGKKVQIKLRPLNNSNFGLFGVRFLQEGSANVEDEEADCTVDLDLTAAVDGLSKSVFSDTSRRDLAAGRAGEGTVKPSPQKYYGWTVLGQNSDRQISPQIAGLEQKKHAVIAQESNTPSVPLKNAFDPLYEEVTGGITVSGQRTLLCEGQNKEIAILKPISVDHDSLKNPTCKTVANTVSGQTMLLGEGQNTEIDILQPISVVGHGSLKKPTCKSVENTVFGQRMLLGQGQHTELDLLKPISAVGLGSLKKPSFKTVNLTRPYLKGAHSLFNKAHSNVSLKAYSAETDLKSSFKELPKEAHSEPDQGVLSKVKWAGKRRQLKPKQRCEFTKGHICSWETIENTSSSSNLVLIKDSYGFNKNQNLGKEIALNTKPFKVYSRTKARRIPKIGGKKELIGSPMEEANEDRDSDAEGDKPLLQRPDSSTQSSSSESEETFLSDSTLDKDQEAELEGLRSLFGNSDHLTDNNQKIRVQEDWCESLQSSPIMNVISTVQEREKQIEGGPATRRCFF